MLVEHNSEHDLAIGCARASGYAVRISQGAPSLFDRPWEALPPDTAELLRAGVPATVEEIIAAIRAGVSDYARPLEGAFGKAVRTGVEQALDQFVELVADPGGTSFPARDFYVALGRGEAREGRSLEALLAAYRLGARVAWRRIASASRAAGADAATIAALAEAVFAYIDELSAQSAEGYAEERAAQAGESERRRRRLVRLLAQDPPPERAQVEAAAREAGWELPDRLAALVWHDEEQGDGRPVARVSPGRLPIGTIAAPLEDRWCALVPDPAAPGRRAELARAVTDGAAVLGPPAPWPLASRSVRRAATAHRLIGEGDVPDSGLVVADDHMRDLIVHADRSLVGDLAERRLEPLAQRPRTARVKLEETLLAWLDHQGRVPEVAEALHVHPQTVRYRLGQLREDLGESLDDPDVRFELHLALRARAGAADGASRDPASPSRPRGD